VNSVEVWNHGSVYACNHTPQAMLSYPLPCDCIPFLVTSQQYKQVWYKVSILCLDWLHKYILAVSRTIINLQYVSYCTTPSVEILVQKKTISRMVMWSGRHFSVCICAECNFAKVWSICIHPQKILFTYATKQSQYAQLCSHLFGYHYAQNYAGIIRQGLERIMA